MEHCEPNVRCSAEDRGREVSCEYKPVDGRMIPFGTGTALGVCWKEREEERRDCTIILGWCQCWAMLLLSGLAICHGEDRCKTYLNMYIIWEPKKGNIRNSCYICILWPTTLLDLILRALSHLDTPYRADAYMGFNITATALPSPATSWPSQHAKTKKETKGTIKGDAHHVSIYGRIWYGIYIPCYGMDIGQEQADVRNSQRRYSGKQAEQLE